MKKLSYFLFILILISACNKDDDSGPSGNDAMLRFKFDFDINQTRLESFESHVLCIIIF